LEVQLRSLLTSALDDVRDQLHIPVIASLVKQPRFSFNRRLLGPMAGLDDLEKEKISKPFRKLNTESTLVHSQP
jgi:hypothetical protein